MALDKEVAKLVGDAEALKPLAGNGAVVEDPEGIAVSDQHSCRGGGVHGRVEGAESDAALVELVDEGDELAGAAPEA